MWEAVAYLSVLSCTGHTSKLQEKTTHTSLAQFVTASEHPAACRLVECTVYVWHGEEQVCNLREQRTVIQDLHL